MILSRNWLNEFVDLKDITDRQFNDDMTLSGSKVETIERPDENLKNVVVGKVLEMKRHENSDHMWVLKIDVGQAEPVQIVTGAWNVHVGDYVPAALHGAHLPGGVKIEKGKLRGVESNGMLCSLKELGMTAEHDFPYAVITPAALLNDYHPIDPAKPSIPADIKPGDKVYGPVVAARVLECAPLGDGTFHTCLDLGNATAVPDTRCSNLHEGDLVAYNTKSDTICTLEDLHAEQKEFPHCIADGIFILREEDAEPGLNMAHILGLDDSIVEFEITPNRPDCLSVIGLAREASATFHRPLKLHEPEPHGCGGSIAELVDIDIEDGDLCPRYTARMVKNVKIAPSPRWMRERLRNSGVRPINNIVDITNYVMLEYGQPMHAFDFSCVEGGHIIVRTAHEGETIQTLDGNERKLTPNMLCICDEHKPVCVAGVMGGANSEIVGDTAMVLFESANFNGVSVRRTASALGMRTDASSRYEKAIDPERCDQALSLAMSLFRELYPDVRVTSFSDQYPEKLRQAAVQPGQGHIDLRLGKHLTNDEIAHKLGLLGFRLDFSGDNMHVTVPTWRSTGDVAIKADIMEEVARMVGYENFQAAPITTSFDGAINQLDKDLERRIKEYLAIRCGMQEIFTYPWMDESYVNAILQDTAGILALSTPPSPTERLIRSSLLPNLCKAVAKNERYFTEFSLFETAQVFKDADYSAPYDPRELLPSQRKNIAGAFVAPAKDVTALFRRAKGAVEQMPRYTHMEGFTFRQEKRPVWADQVVWLNIFLGEEQVGNLALLARKPAMACGIKNLAVMLFELDVDALKPFRSRTNRFTHLPEYPMTDYDISLLFDSQVKWSQMYDVIAQGIREGGLLHGADFVDEYHGKQVPAGKKSVTIRLTIGSLEKTLTSTEIEECASGVIKKLTKRLGAELRTR